MRGIGLLGGIELVADKRNRRNFDPALRAGPRLAKLCEKHGVIGRVLPGDVLAFSPPLIITKEENDEILERVSRALDDLTGQLAGG